MGILWAGRLAGNVHSLPPQKTFQLFTPSRVYGYRDARESSFNRVGDRLRPTQSSESPSVWIEGLVDVRRVGMGVTPDRPGPRDDDPDAHPDSQQFPKAAEPQPNRNSSGNANLLIGVFRNTAGCRRSGDRRSQDRRFTDSSARFQQSSTQQTKMSQAKTLIPLGMAGGLARSLAPPRPDRELSCPSGAASYNAAEIGVGRPVASNSPDPLVTPDPAPGCTA